MVVGNLLLQVLLRALGLAMHKKQGGTKMLITKRRGRNASATGMAKVALLTMVTLHIRLWGCSPLMWVGCAPRPIDAPSSIPLAMFRIM